jgi:hypothetical protein
MRQKAAAVGMKCFVVDTECRYIYAEHSRDQLKIRKSMLARIFSFHHVMPEYLDFVMSFGLQVAAREIRFSGFRRQVSLKRPPAALSIDALGRSGRQYQMAYNLKGVARPTNDPGTPVWSIRNAAIYHQFDVGTGRALWIVTKGRMDIYDRYKELTGPDARPEDKAFGTPEECFLSSLSPHLLFCHWATEDWRGYIRWFEETIDQEVDISTCNPKDFN